MLSSCWRKLSRVYLNAVQVILQPVESMEAIRSCIATHLSRYNDKFGNVKLDIMLTDNALKSIVRLHRVLTLEHRLEQRL